MAVLAGLVFLPPSTPEPSVAAEPAIGGGPRAEPTGAVCHTADGAPYEAERCPRE